jgi:hypothetical protein
VNQELALSASSTGLFATIDLSDASDRVPWELALEMFSVHPDLQAAVESCRSDSAELPDGRIVSPLRKFASMGSALCFPVEAMYFYTICVMARLEKHNLPVTPRNVFQMSRGVYVYGDDIIVPTTDAVVVLDYLQKYNCKVNSNKTFTSGSFRESCGIDAFDGTSVTPTYVRHLRPENKRQVQNIVSWVATSNLFYKRGYWRTAQAMRNSIDRVIGPLPYVSETSPALGYTSNLGTYFVTRQYFDSGDLLYKRPRSKKNVRWNRELHRLEIRAWVPEPIYRAGRLDGYSALGKCLRDLERINTSLPRTGDDAHLERYALHGAVALKRRWVDPLS